MLVVLAVPDVVVVQATRSGSQEIYFDPGIVQFQQDYILGPANQLLGGGALLVNDPVSQYGVGLIYFVAGWFHIAPIGYGTFALPRLAADGAVLHRRLRGAAARGRGRLLAAGALALGVVTFVYNFLYFVGQLPEEGPLRFGLPMVVLLGVGRGDPVAAGGRLWRGSLAVAGWRSPRCGRSRRSPTRRSRTSRSSPPRRGCARPARGAAGSCRRLAYGLGAIVAGHLVFAMATLVGSGHLPDWGQYLAYGPRVPARRPAPARSPTGSPTGRRDWRCTRAR